MYRFASDDPVDVDELRTRLRRMSDRELVDTGRACALLFKPHSAGQRDRRGSSSLANAARAEAVPVYILASMPSAGPEPASS